MNRSRMALWGAEFLLLLVSAWQLWAIGNAMALRIPFPFDIEWMEGGTLVSAWRVAHGLPIHGEPDLTYIPFIYPPFYPALVGYLSSLFPLDYPLARGVSAASTGLAMLALVYGTRKAGGRWPLAIGLATAFLGTWDDCGTFYDLIRVDALTIALLGWALVLGNQPALWQTVLSGVLLAFAYATKHNAALWGFPMIAGIYWQYGKKQAAIFGAASAIPALLFTLIYNVATDGNFLKWLIEVPAQHGVKAERLISGISWHPSLRELLQIKTAADGAQYEMWLALPVFVTLALLFPRWLWRNVEARYWAGVAAAGLVACSLMRGHIGGFINVLIPMYWIESLWPALVLATLAESWAQPATGRLATLASRLPWRNPDGAVVGVTLLAALQVLQGANIIDYNAKQGIGPNLSQLVDVKHWERQLDWKLNYARYLPTEKNWKEAESFIEELKELPEPILIPHAPFAAIQAGKQPSFSLICLWDIDYKGGPYRPYVREVEAAMKAKHWASAVLPNDELGYELKKHYKNARLVKHIAPDTRVGWEVRLKQVWLPREEVVEKSPD